MKMNNLQFNVNDCSIKINMPVDKNGFSRRKIKKINLFSKLFLPVPKIQGDLIFFAKNCDFNCFDKNVAISANLETLSGSDNMYGTSSYMFFNKKKLRFFIFQVIYNEAAAMSFYDDFSNKAIQYLGERSSVDEKIYPNQAEIWKDGDEILILEMASSKKHAYVYWNIESQNSLMEQFTSRK